MPEAKDYGTVGYLLLPTVQPLHIDEEVQSLYEEDRIVPGGFVRVQVIRVYRGGKLTEFPRVMGPSSNYNAGPFIIPAFGAHTVGEVLEMAEQLRPALAKGVATAMAEHAAEFDPLKAAVEQHEMTREYMRRNPLTYRRDSGKGK